MKLIVLNYHDTILECAQDAYTFSVNTDVMIDLDLYLYQNNHNTLLLDYPDSYASIVLLYMSRYPAFTASLR